MVLLVVAEFSAYLSVTTESKVILDHFDSSSDDTLQVQCIRIMSACGFPL
jgi:hypothetical protein